ncbi:CAAX farnesyltransferase (FTase) subunit beta, partial [Coemansia sp. RSA 2611]
MSHVFSYDFRYDDNECETETSVAQAEVEDLVGDIYLNFVEAGTLAQGGGAIDDSRHKLLRAKHEQFIHDAINGLPSSFTLLDASQPWFSFWCLNSLEILGCNISQQLRSRVIDKLSRLQCPGGGFCGGSGQLPHLAGSYGAIMALVLVGGNAAYETIDRPGMYSWLMSMKCPDGAFTMHAGGEVDVRGIYCALVIASLLNIMTPELVKGAAEFIA